MVYTELDKYTDSTKRYLHPDEYQQMSGRAGRRGLDTNGTVIYCPIKEIVPKTDLSTMMLGNSPKMISKFSLNYQLILRLYLQNKQNHILQYVEQSLYKTQLLDDVTKMENDLISREKELMDFPKDWTHTVEKYYQLTQQMSNGSKIKQNQLKKIRKEMTQIEADLPNLEKEMDRYKLYQKKCDDIEELKSSKLQYPQLIAKDLEKNTMFLKENGFIKDNQITLKGIYSTEINECNEIFTEIIYNEFNDCQPASVAIHVIHKAKWG